MKMIRNSVVCFLLCMVALNVSAQESYPVQPGKVRYTSTESYMDASAIIRVIKTANGKNFQLGDTVLYKSEDSIGNAFYSDKIDIYQRIEINKYCTMLGGRANCISAQNLMEPYIKRLMNRIVSDSASVKVDGKLVSFEEQTGPNGEPTLYRYNIGDSGRVATCKMYIKKSARYVQIDSTSFRYQGANLLKSQRYLCKHYQFYSVSSALVERIYQDGKLVRETAVNLLNQIALAPYTVLYTYDKQGLLTSVSTTFTGVRESYENYIISYRDEEIKVVKEEGDPAPKDRVIFTFSRLKE